MTGGTMWRRAASCRIIFTAKGYNSLTGFGADDALSGSDGDNTLRGNTGDYTLLAGMSDDRLFGGIGDDHITFDQGDLGEGDESDDTFYFYAALPPAAIVLLRGDAGDDQFSIGSSAHASFDMDIDVSY